MKLHDKSCLLDSFAYILEMEPKELAHRVGHDGPEGYHSQELIEICLQEGWAVTRIERNPVSRNPETYAVSAIRFPEGNDRRFVRWLKSGSSGVLMGNTPLKFKTHSVAWVGMVYDPGIDQHYELLTDSDHILELNYIPQVFLRMDKL